MTTTTDSMNRFQVADLAVDLAQRRVARAGVALELSALNFDLLRVLIQSAPNVVTYEELAEKVWERHFVSPENIAQRIKLLRQSLADDASEPRFIETIRGRGYRLIPTVEALAEPAAASAGAQRLSLSKAILGAALVLIAAAGAYSLGPRFSDTAEGERGAPLPNSVAILPFKNLSPDPDDAYFAAGIYEEIFAQLAGTPNLSPIALSSVQPYADAGKSIHEIADALNVEKVMEGSVRYSGDRVRVTANLIDPETGLSAWSEVYDRELGDMFSIQEDIASNIAAALGAALDAPARPGSYGHATTSPEAAALYLKVLDLQRRNSFDTDVQLAYLDRALEFDDRFANLYALKATVYAFSVVDRAGGRALDVDPEPLERLALENAAKALELDPRSTQAYLAIGTIDRFFWRWADALQAFEKAYELSPNDTDVLGDLASLLSWIGQHERAIRLRERTIELDPASATMRWGFGVTLAQARRPEAARDVLRTAVAMDPTAANIRHWLGESQAASGDPAQALLDLRATERLGGVTSPTLVAGLLYSYSRIDQPADVARLVGELKKLAAVGTVGAGTWALAHLALNERDEAYRWLETAVEKIERHEPDAGFLNLMTIKTNSQLDPVLDEPRFRRLRDRIGVLD